jgi:hypothetical protein
LCGPRERVVERLAAWERSPVTTMLVSTVQVEALEALVEGAG